MPRPGCHRLHGGTECCCVDGWFGQVWVLLHSQAPAGGPWTRAGQCLAAHLGCSKVSLASTGCKPGPGGGASTTFPEGVVLGSGGPNRLSTDPPRDTWVWCLHYRPRAVSQTRSHSRISFLLNVSKPHGVPRVEQVRGNRNKTSFPPKVVLSDKQSQSVPDGLGSEGARAGRMAGTGAQKMQRKASLSLSPGRCPGPALPRGRHLR